MKRSPLIRIQLLLVVVFAGLLVWRSQWRPGPADADLALAKLEPGALAHAALVVDSATSVAIDAAGSLETPGGTVLAAYPWIVRRDDRSVVWQLLPGSVESDGTLQTVLDTLILQPATYDVWFTSYGPTRQSREDASFLGLKPHWTNDADDWRMVLTALPGSVVRVVSDSSPEVAAPDDVLWSSSPLNRNASSEWLFSVDVPSRVRIRAIGAPCDGACDTAWIEDVFSGAHAWDFTLSDSEPAGGAKSNRLYDGTVSIPAGLYRARSESRGNQAWGHWEDNPPLDPAGWGLALVAGEGVSAYDPWKSEPLVSIGRVGSGETRQATLTLENPARLVVAAMGEIGSGGTTYDFAWIERGEKRVPVWQMTDARAGRAGGDRSNRQETVFLDLPADYYTVRYQTDDSHAYDDWRRRKPDFPERWGVSVFLAPSGTVGADIAVQMGAGATGSDLEVELVEETVGTSGDVSVVFSAVQLGNDKTERFSFSVSESAEYRIEATGEISQSGRYDYGWIERDGKVVWEMTMQNTRPAGGDERNRQFDGVVRLGAGSYTLHFETDFSHAFGDFGDGPPRLPAAWGIRLSRIG